MKTTNISDFKFSLTHYVGTKASLRVLKNGEPVGVWLAPHEYEALRAMADSSQVSEDHDKVRAGELDGFVDGAEDGRPPENGNLFFKRMSAVEQMREMIKKAAKEAGTRGPKVGEQLVGFGLALVADAITELAGSGWARVVGPQGTRFRNSEIEVGVRGKS